VSELPAASFDRVADLYARVRPGYPAALFDRICDFGALAPGAELVEIGGGTGLATRSFAERGFVVTCIEPGTALATLARAALADYAVEVQTTSFEDWDAPPGRFAAAFAAQSFHWISPELRLPKLAQALRPHGILAVFGHAPALAPGPAHDAIQEVYRRHAPSLGERSGAREWYGQRESPVAAELSSSPCFGEVTCDLYDWQQTFGMTDYCDLLKTYSDHSTLPPEQLRALVDGIGAAIERHGGTVTVDYRTGLFLARAS
jgi:trans-aconitate methyltransferase